VTPKQQFVDTVFQLYLTMPDTPDRFSAHDCFIAKRWFDDGVSIVQVQQAVILAQVRRAFRRSADPPLNPIRSLHYFTPIIQEIQRNPMDVGYFRYLQKKLNDLKNPNPDPDATRPDSSTSE
jgi:hypothetical protein